MPSFRLSRPHRALVATSLVAAALSGVLPAADLVNNPSSAERFAKPSEGLVASENHHYLRTPLEVPEGIVLEVSGITPIPGRALLVTTRRGEIWRVDGAYDSARPKFTLFASGLHEPLGILAAPGGGYYVAQRQELTRIRDTDGDGRADAFETVAKLPISGSYHEYAFGPIRAPNGNLRLTLNVAFGGSTQAPAPWRGWMMEITPDGQMIPIAAGLRSPTGFVLTSGGEWFCGENQGEWVGSGRLMHLTPGDFTGHPAGLAWSRLPGSTVKLRPSDIRDFEQPMAEVAKSLPGLKPPAVWLPHTVLGISTSGVIEDVTGGKFGPFAGQLLVADQGQSKIARVSLEQVKGTWQGAAYAFREGFDCGIIRIAFGDGATLFAGESARGWGSVGPRQYGLERLTYTGVVPFEIREVKAQPDGFLLTFTQPVDPAAASRPESYAVSGFTYLYHKAYGSAPVNRMSCPVRKVNVAPDGLSARIALACLREGYVHEIRAAGLRARDGGQALLHATAFYTLNRFPDGDRIVPPDPKEAELCIAPVPPAAAANTRKHPTKVPAGWPGEDGDQTIILGTLPGLQFDQALITAPAGSRLRLVFRNTDEMLHNFVLCAPGRGTAVGEAAMALGVDGAARSYVPDSADVLYHTALMLPQGSDTIFIDVPGAPGDYDYLCSFPGHAAQMKGILRVTPRAAAK